MRQLFRPVWNSIVFARASYATAAKGQLATLRKQTGYSIKNCKNALEIHGSDLEAAIKWLNEEAQKQGWEKATKLQNRITTQGLIGVHIKDKTAALVEVSCETDFVAKNGIFKDLVKNVASACCIPDNTKSRDVFREESLSPGKMENLKWDGKILKDHAAQAISQLGENIVLRRSLLLHASENVVLSTSVHPNTGNILTPLFGTYGAVVALKMTDSCVLKVQAVEALGRQLCMHVIGMKPQRIKPNPDEAKSEAAPVQNSRPSSDESEEQSETYQEAPEKDFLLGQDFVFNAELTVEQLLTENCLEVVHFVRFERGETAEVHAVDQ